MCSKNDDAMAAVKRGDWADLSGEDWSNVLIEHPELSEHCDWEKLDGMAWSSLLSEQPQFADKCPWEKLDKDGLSWGFLLRFRPEFAAHCHCGEKWCELLNASPEFIAGYDWSRLGIDDWVPLLLIHPEFADKCNWLQFFKALFGPSLLRTVLELRPELVEKINCDWSKLTGRQMFYTLLSLPELAGRYTWDKMYPGPWVELLCQYPEIADKVRIDFSRFSKYHWRKLLESKPQFIDRFDASRFDAKTLTWLCMEQPLIADRFDVNLFDVRTLAGLCVKQPLIADKIRWSRFDAGTLAELSETNPGFIAMFIDKFGAAIDLQRVSVSSLCRMLKINRAIADRFDLTSRSVEDLGRILVQFPEFLPRIPDNLLARIRFQHPGQYVRLMKIDPRLEKTCPWGRLSESHWVELASERPELMCHWTGRKLRPYSWVRLIEKCPVAAFGCPWEEFEEHHWEMLLEIRPQYKDLHVIYTEEDPEKIMKVLLRAPELIGHCYRDVVEKLQAVKDWKQFVDANPHWSQYWY